MGEQEQHQALLVAEEVVLIKLELPVVLVRQLTMVVMVVMDPYHLYQELQ